MGCASSSGVSSPNTAVVTYVKDTSARAEPLYALLCHSKQDYLRADLHPVKFLYRTKISHNTGEMGGFPSMQYKGKQRNQLGACMRMIGIEKGYYDPKDWK